MTDKTIYEVAQDVIDNFQEDNKISNHVDFNMQDVLDQSDAYYNHRFVSSKQDSLGRDKPFFNIVKAKVNIAKRATDIDTKHIKLKAKNSDNYFKTFIANLKLREWMKKNDYASYLNKWGKILPKSGSAVTKYTGNGANIELVPWNRMVCDPVDFYSAPQVEKLFLTPQELRRRDYDQDVVDELMAELGNRKNSENEDINDNGNFIELWEVHGELPLSYLTEKESDEETYQQQMHVVARVLADSGDVKDFTLYSGRETKSPYTITHWDEEDGRTLGIGIIEDLFEAQEMINYSKKAQKDQLDLASKMIFQTTDGNFGSSNVLTEVETGDVLVTELNKPLTQLNNQADVVALENYSNQWDMNANLVASTPDAISGNTMPSNTPLGSVQIQNQEAHSLFEWIREQKGLAIERDLREYIIPYIKTQLDTTEEIVATLSQDELAWFDNLVVKQKTYKYVKDKLSKKEPILDGELVERELEIRNMLNTTGNTRFINANKMSWKEYFKDFEWDVDIEITGENSDKQAKLTTLFTLFQTVASNPAILQDKTSRVIFNKILETAGSLSPSELPPIQPQQQLPQQASTGSPPKVSPDTVEKITSGQINT